MEVVELTQSHSDDEISSSKVSDDTKTDHVDKHNQILTDSNINEDIKPKDKDDPEEPVTPTKTVKFLEIDGARNSGK